MGWGISLSTKCIISDFPCEALHGNDESKLLIMTFSICCTLSVWLELENPICSLYCVDFICINIYYQLNKISTAGGKLKSTKI